MQSVRESRDHHLFDGYPRLIAVFRALQSLLMPSHPPCALCSLTTRIESSRTSLFPGKLPPGYLIAGPPKGDHDSTRLNDFFSLFFRSPSSSQTAGIENQSFDVHCWTAKSEPWENASRGPLETDLLRHSFKMPITTTKLSTNENEPAWRQPMPARTREPILGKSGIGRNERRN